MKHSFDFDCIIDRSCSGAMKHELLHSLFGRRDLTPLWIADMDFACSPAITEALRHRLDHPIYGYQQVPASYWQSIIDWNRRRHGVTLSEEELTFSSGVVKAIAHCINFFTNPGDGVIIQEPVYNPFRNVTEATGRVVVNNALVPVEDGYEMDFELLEAQMKAGAKLMILCNPHNPAGVQWYPETLRKVADLAKHHGVIVVSDEIHGDLMLWGNAHEPFTEVSPEAAEIGIWLGAPSKTFNIPGFMSSWIAIRNPKLREPFFKWLEANKLNDPSFMATIATEAAYNQAEDWLDAMLRYVESNIRMVEDFAAVEMPGVRPVRPDASFLVWLDMRGLGISHEQIVDRLVNKAHLALNDGTAFGADARGFMRLNVATPHNVLHRALIAMKEAFADIPR